MVSITSLNICSPTALAERLIPQSVLGSAVGMTWGSAVEMNLTNLMGLPIGPFWLKPIGKSTYDTSPTLLPSLLCRLLSFRLALRPLQGSSKRGYPPRISGSTHSDCSDLARSVFDASCRHPRSKACRAIKYPIANMLTTDDEKRPSASTDTAPDHKSQDVKEIPATAPYKGGLLGAKSPGVQRIEAISAHFTFTDRVCVFLGVFLIAYAYGLDGTIRYTYQVRKSAVVLPIGSWCNASF